MTTMTLERRPIARENSVKLRPLAQLLCELEIAPYSTESVEAYKNNVLREKRGRVGSWAAKHQRVIGYGALGALMCGVCMAMFTLVLALCQAWSIAGFFFFVFMACIGVFSGLKKVFDLSEWHWKKTRLTLEKTSEMPPEAQESVRAIWNRLPWGCFFVDELGYDPFLLVEYGKESYYIHFWNEPYTGNRFQKAIDIKA